MRLIDPSVFIVNGLPPLQKIALIARVCTGTQDKAETTPEAALAFCKKLLNMGHTSPFEHARVIVPYNALRQRQLYYKGNPPYGVADRIESIDGYHYVVNVRDLLAEGRTLDEIAGYEDAGGYLTACFDISIGISRELCRHRSMSFMERSTRWCSWWPEEGGVEFIRPAHILNPEVLALACSNAEDEYFAMLANKEAREHARDVLPLATATRLYVTGTYEHWAALLRLRLGKRAHPEMRRIMEMLCELPDFPAEIKGMVNHEEEA